MKRWLETQAYRMCWRSGWLATCWASFWYRHYCPYPVIEDFSARACIKAGKCSCDNLDIRSRWAACSKWEKAK